MRCAIAGDDIGVWHDPPSGATHRADARRLHDSIKALSHERHVDYRIFMDAAPLFA
jgi:hypothetical protein